MTDGKTNGNGRRTTQFMIVVGGLSTLSVGLLTYCITGEVLGADMTERMREHEARTEIRLDACCAEIYDLRAMLARIETKLDVYLEQDQRLAFPPQ
jgi:hypothetical protein